MIILEGCPVHCRLFSSIPGLYPLDASSTPLQIVTTKNVYIVKCPLGEKLTTNLENGNCLEMKCVTSGPYSFKRKGKDFPLTISSYLLVGIWMWWGVFFIHRHFIHKIKTIGKKWQSNNAKKPAFLINILPSYQPYIVYPAWSIRVKKVL